MYEPVITIVGNVAGPPRLRTLPTGATVATFRVANTPRRQDRSDNTWSDGETTWFDVSAWRGLAEHCSASLDKGDRVIVSGRLSTRSFDTQSGEHRSNLEIDATSVGLDLSRGAAAYVRPPRLVTDEDPWVSSGQVDPLTGEVRPEGPTGDRKPGDAVAEAA